MNKLVILDGHSIVYRSFYALPPLNNSEGLPTNAVLGFANIVLKVLEDEKPTHFLITFDSGKKTFRNEIYTDYKANRSGVNDDLKVQFPLVEELAEAFGIKVWKFAGFESDDLIGTITKKLHGIPIHVVTGDRDLFQLVSDDVTVIYMRKGISEVEFYTPGTIQVKYGLQPHQLIDVKALMGDKSDNIPGIEGIGERTALKLIAEYGSLENLLNNLHHLKGKIKERLENGRDMALLSRELATICTDIPTDLELEDLEYTGYDPYTLLPLLERLEFKSIMKRLKLPRISRQSHASPVVICSDDTSMEKLVNDLPDVDVIHAESLGENPHRAELVGIVFHTGKVSYFLPADCLRSNQRIAEWLADPTRSKALYDYNRTGVVLARHGIELRGVSFDVLLAAYLKSPTHENLTLDKLSQEHDVPYVQPDADVYGAGARQKVPEDLNIVASHAASKAMAIKELIPILAEELHKLALHDVFITDLEMAYVLIRCELAGITLDVEGLKQYGEYLKNKINDLEEKIYSLVGKEFSIGSPKQLASVLFDDLGMPPVKKTKTGYSTDAEVLEKLRDKHPVVELILEHRMLSSLYSKFIDGLTKEIHEDGKIHTYYNMALTTTGRLSSQFPNMQNIPVRTEEGRQIRKMFLPSKSEGMDYIMNADYSQIELRILAHLSQDPKMKEAFEKGMDIHTQTAMDIFEVPEDQVTPEMRRQAKAINFGMVYGITEHGLANNAKMSKDEAQQFMEKYFATYPKVKEYMDMVVKEARKNGYVVTIKNRRRYLPELYSKNLQIRKGAERMAMNTPIQGSAADIIKLAMIEIEKEFRKRNLKSRMLLQVHDELIFEVSEEELPTVLDIVRDKMENTVQLSVPLKVDINYGKTWYDAK